MTFNTDIETTVSASENGELVLELIVAPNGQARIATGCYDDKSRRCVDGFTIDTLKQLIAEHEKVRGI